MNGVLLERELRGTTADGYRSKALGGAIEVEHLREVLLETRLAKECSRRL